jgi:hypothetical protein
MPPRSAAALAALATSACASAAPSCDASFAFDAREAAFTTAPYFASWNIDSSGDREFFMLDWSAPALTAAAAGLAAGGGARVRFGGTGNNELVYAVPGAPPCVPAPHRTCLNETTWRGVAAVAAAADSPIIFGVNFFPGGVSANPTFDPTNAVAFFEFARARGDAIWGVERGNELGPDSKTMTAAEQGAGLLVLDAALAALYGDAQRPVLVGPDALGFHTPAPPAAAGGAAASAFVPSADILAYMTDFVTAVGPRLHAGA